MTSDTFPEPIINLNTNHKLLTSLAHCEQIKQSDEVVLNRLGKAALRWYCQDDDVPPTHLLDPDLRFTVQTIKIRRPTEKQLPGFLCYPPEDWRWGYAIITVKPYTQRIILIVNLAHLSPARTFGAEQHHYVIGAKTTLAGSYAYVGKEDDWDYAFSIEHAKQFSTAQEARKFIQATCSDPVVFEPEDPPGINPRLVRSGLAHDHFCDRCTEGTFEIIEVVTKLTLVDSIDESELIHDQELFQKMLAQFEKELAVEAASDTEPWLPLASVLYD